MRHSESHAFLRSVFLHPQRQRTSTPSTQLAACSRKSTDHFGSNANQCQDELRSSCKAGYHQRASVCALSMRGRSSSAPREAWTEHEHHRIELFTDPSLRERCSSMAMPRGQSHGLSASHEWYRTMSLLCVQGQRVCTDGREVAPCVKIRSHSRRFSSRVNDSDSDESK